MGFTSFQCNGCKRSILSEHASNPTNKWMVSAIAIHKLGHTLAEGIYDGYGRILPFFGPEVDLHDYDKHVSVYHSACYKAAGEPGFTGQSDPAEDQGFYFNPGAHDVHAPTTLNELEAIKVASS